MAVLKNSRHEAFARHLVGGMSATEAYVEAGYVGDRTAASRLSSNVNIQERVAELAASAALRTEISVASLTERLLRIADAAEGLNDAAGLSVARASLMDAAKLNGLLVDRTENRSTVYTVSDIPLTDDEWAEKFGTQH